MSIKNRPTTASVVSTISGQDKIPCVRYALPGNKQLPTLHTIFEPIPEGVITASPIYFLTRNEYERQYSGRYGEGYVVSGYKSIATKLQDNCEQTGRVLYPIYVESDVFWEYGPNKLIDWSEEFLEDYLGIPFASCKLYFSGGKSIHVHAPRFLAKTEEIPHLKDKAEQFCEETGAELDCSIYTRKRMFRLPGIEHEDTGIPKFEFDRAKAQVEISQKFDNQEASHPENYEQVLRQVHSKDSVTVNSANREDYSPQDLFERLNPDKAVLDLLPEKREIETPLIERTDNDYPEDPIKQIKWLQYNAKEFSPYALAKENKRSVASFQVKGTPFGRKDVTGGSYSRPVYALVPTYFYGAHGCAGDEFTKSNKHAPLQLSSVDYQKWEKRGFQPGDHVVIIGGQNRSSIILKVTPWQARIVGLELTGEDASRQGAIEFLKQEGYDTGSAGRSQLSDLTAKLVSENSGTSATDVHYDESRIYPARENPQSDAERYQLIAERDGIENLGYPELVSIACKHLQYGWDPTFKWFKEQFGSNFDPQETWTHLKSIMTSWPQDYTHIEVPPKP